MAIVEFDGGRIRTRQASVANGLTCNGTIHAAHLADDVPILDFTHVVSYRFTASRACFGKTEQAWNAYVVWMTAAWRREVDTVIDALERHQERIGRPAAGLPLRHFHQRGTPQYDAAKMASVGFLKTKVPSPIC